MNFPSEDELRKLLNAAATRAAECANEYIKFHKWTNWSYQEADDADFDLTDFAFIFKEWKCGDYEYIAIPYALLGQSELEWHARWKREQDFWEEQRQRALALQAIRDAEVERETYERLKAKFEAPK